MPSKNIIPNLDELKKMLHTGNEDFLRQALRQMLNLMMELEVEAKNKAAKHERNSERKAYRNGTRERSLSTCVGEVVLQILKLRSGQS